MRAQLAPIDDAAGATAVETSHGSTQGPSTVETAPPELSASQEVRAQLAPIDDAAGATQHASGATMPTLAISDERHNQMFQDFEIQGYGSTATLGPKPPIRHAPSRGRGGVQADSDNVANKLNKAELSSLVRCEGALR